MNCKLFSLWPRAGLFVAAVGVTVAGHALLSGCSADAEPEVQTESLEQTDAQLEVVLPASAADCVLTGYFDAIEGPETVRRSVSTRLVKNESIRLADGMRAHTLWLVSGVYDFYFLPADVDVEALSEVEIPDLKPICSRPGVLVEAGTLTRIVME